MEEALDPVSDLLDLPYGLKTRFLVSTAIRFQKTISDKMKVL
jgi:hypothetical protein